MNFPLVGLVRTSVYKAQGGREKINWLSLDLCHRLLGAKVSESWKMYEEFIKGKVVDDEWNLIRKAV